MTGYRSKVAMANDKLKEQDMSKMAELAYEIEQLYIEGFSPKSISVQLECPLELVYNWIEGQGLGVAEEPHSPYETINS